MGGVGGDCHKQPQCGFVDWYFVFIMLDPFSVRYFCPPPPAFFQPAPRPPLIAPHIVIVAHIILYFVHFMLPKTRISGVYLMRVRLRTHRSQIRSVRLSALTFGPLFFFLLARTAFLSQIVLPHETAVDGTAVHSYTTVLALRFAAVSTAGLAREDGGGGGGGSGGGGGGGCGCGCGSRANGAHVARFGGIPAVGRRRWNGH